MKYQMIVLSKEEQFFCGQFELTSQYNYSFLLVNCLSIYPPFEPEQLSVVISTFTHCKLNPLIIFGFY